jgi:predicted TIM-barrel fold metal-dependent hydrolase
MKKIALIIFISVFLSGFKSANISLNFNEEKDDLYLFDAQSQFSQDIKIQEVLNIIKRSGVQRVILSTTQRQKNAIVYEIAKQNPERIIPGARVKIRSFYYGYEKRLKKQLDIQLARWPKYSVITEALIYHAKKKPRVDPEGKNRPEISVDPYSPQVKYVIKKAKQLDIPVVLHIESRSLDLERKLELWKKLEKLMYQNPKVSFVYTHMAQLDSKEISSLINRHKNIYFFLQNTSLIDDKSVKRFHGVNKWTCVFCETWDCHKGDLKPEWEELFISHPSRFIFAVDGVESWIWRKRYEKIVREWKIAISKLPKHVGKKIAHENAERLWHIKPLY